ncbi:MAG: biopolymer transporter ExbD [Sandaracinaceae bacterium]|nr:biopolymer transporter ExbD [Sandaracinaceae bacterium]MBP7681229.1 biopolymer transporter ExbD [Deltaproteobacteria bacterium]MBK6812976.1 biopolymer transporter ExbD [Sandaracinaceae bacterium]MBK7152575.1 biopolymer transporter ExbD [Sandaracinaceae bacterium]MBK7773800.1 biopolymer transporter ExbD [Sandaracinaceae bacterium]
MGFSSGSGRGGPLSEINVTPLVDVMLVLLIIFMVAAPMMTTGVSVDLPNADAPRMEIDEEQPVISVEAGGRLFLREEELTLSELETRLMTDEDLRARDEVYIQADETVPYGDVVRVLALVRRAGIGKMGLVTDPLDRERAAE